MAAHLNHLGNSKNSNTQASLAKILIYASIIFNISQMNLTWGGGVSELRTTGLPLPYHLTEEGELER